MMRFPILMGTFKKCQPNHQPDMFSYTGRPFHYFILAISGSQDHGLKIRRNRPPVMVSPPRVVPSIDPSIEATNVCYPEDPYVLYAIYGNIHHPYTPNVSIYKYIYIYHTWILWVITHVATCCLLTNYNSRRFLQVPTGSMVSAGVRFSVSLFCSNTPRKSNQKKQINRNPQP